MTSFVLPHEVHGDGARTVSAVHGRCTLPGFGKAPDAYGPGTASDRADGKERR
ncbi:hypothetical protein [Streptomyces sp. NPDC048192]|uniref:hypothetical protein n=1 Tax=Streptomyces sp. NPDC048192 TaxID=3365510 RepID=UPI003715C5A8